MADFTKVFSGHNKFYPPSIFMSVRFDFVIIFLDSKFMENTDADDWRVVKGGFQKARKPWPRSFEHVMLKIRVSSILRFVLES